MAKLLTSVVTERLSHLVETLLFLPVTHFRGCPNCTTTDTLHLLANTVKAAWRKKKVVSALFLDVEEVFLNAVTHCLTPNMWWQQVPVAYIAFIDNMLLGWKTHLKFDNFTSDWFDLDNGIGK